MIEKPSIIEKSSHKNFIEWYWRNRNALINNEIMPYQDAIFDLFNIKFKFDASKDWERKRIKLKQLWIDCSNYCKSIHEILKTNEFFEDYDELIETVNKIVDMDYWSLQEFFNTLKNNYTDQPKIHELLDKICEKIWEMRKISRDHTEIIKQY